MAFCHKKVSLGLALEFMCSRIRKQLESTHVWQQTFQNRMRFEGAVVLRCMLQIHNRKLVESTDVWRCKLQSQIKKAFWKHKCVKAQASSSDSKVIWKHQCIKAQGSRTSAVDKLAKKAQIQHYTHAHTYTRTNMRAYPNNLERCATKNLFQVIISHLTSLSLPLSLRISPPSIHTPIRMHARMHSRADPSQMSKMRAHTRRHTDRCRPNSRIGVWTFPLTLSPHAVP